jgi:hypothetical protein
MKIRIDLAEEVYPVITLGHNNLEYYSDYIPGAEERKADIFNSEVPDDLAKKWVKVFLEFENVQKEIAEYFGDDCFRPKFCEFDSLENIK